ncbi:MAG: hypothetical protein AAB947_01600 [Patescibacteria group bacterium]
MKGFEKLGRLGKRAIEKAGTVFKDPPTQEENAVKEVRDEFDQLYEKGLRNNALDPSGELKPEEMGTGVADAVKTLENVRSEQRERERMAEKEKTPLWPDA